MIDKAKVMKEAQKLIAKGQIDKGILEWKKIADAHPDGNTFNTIGDLYIRNNKKDAAIVEYHKAAQFYLDGGFSLKALAIHKKVLNINPKDPTALIALGKLNEEKNIIIDAIKYYLAAADVLSKENRKEELIEVFDKILVLAPENIKLRVKISDLFSKEGFIPEAAQEYCNIAKLYAAKDDLENAKSYLGMAVEIQPNNRKVLIALSDLAEKEGDFNSAESYIQSAIEKTGEDVEILIKGSNLFLRSGSIDESLNYLNRALEMEPDNLEVRKLRADIYQQTGDIMSAWEEYKEIIDPLIEAEQYAESISILETFKEFDAVENRRRLVSLYKMDGNEEHAFKELFDLHVAYTELAKITDALAALKEAKEIKPDDEEVNQAIAEIERMLEHPTTPVPEDNSSETATAEDEMGSMEVPDEAPAEDEMGSMEVPDEAPAEDEMGSMEVPDEAPAAEPQMSAEDKTLTEKLNEAEVFFKYGLMEDAKNLLEKERVNYPNSIDLHQKLMFLYKETNNIDSLVTECVIMAALNKSQGNDDLSEKFILEAFELSPHDPRLEGKVDGWTPKPEEPVIAPEPTVASGPKVDTSPLASFDSPAGSFDPQQYIDQAVEGHKEQISEADFYIKQGFFEEAAELYRKIVETVPEDEELKAKLVELEAKAEEVRIAKAAKAEESIVPFAGEEEESLFDVSSILDDEGAQGGPDLAAMDDEVLGIFDEFKKGLSQEIEAEDSETHYDLGIAYKEMGILDDAIKEFHVAQRDPSYYTQCATMIGICYMQKGTFSLAVDAFTSALMKIEPGDDTKWSIKYDLADAYEKNGNLNEALQLFVDVSKWNPSFREVSSRMEALKKQAPEAAKVSSAPASSKPKDKQNRVSYI